MNLRKLEEIAWCENFERHKRSAHSLVLENPRVLSLLKQAKYFNGFIEFRKYIMSSLQETRSSVKNSTENAPKSTQNTDQVKRDQAFSNKNIISLSEEKEKIIEQFLGKVLDYVSEEKNNLLRKYVKELNVANVKKFLSDQKSQDIFMDKGLARAKSLYLFLIRLKDLPTTFDIMKSIYDLLYSNNDINDIPPGLKGSKVLRDFVMAGLGKVILTNEDRDEWRKEWHELSPWATDSKSREEAERKFIKNKLGHYEKEGEKLRNQLCREQVSQFENIYQDYLMLGSAYCYYDLGWHVQETHSGTENANSVCLNEFKRLLDETKKLVSPLPSSSGIDKFYKIEENIEKLRTLKSDIILQELKTQKADDEMKAEVQIKNSQEEIQALLDRANDLFKKVSALDLNVKFRLIEIISILSVTKIEGTYSKGKIINLNNELISFEVEISTYKKLSSADITFPAILLTRDDIENYKKGDKLLIEEKIDDEFVAVSTNSNATVNPQAINNVPKSLNQTKTTQTNRAGKIREKIGDLENYLQTSAEEVGTEYCSSSGIWMVPKTKSAESTEKKYNFF